MGIRKSHCLGFIALSVALSSGAAIATSSARGVPISNSSCMECHGDKSLTTTNAAGKEISLFVDLRKLAASVHKTNTCAACHADVSSKHPDDNVPVKRANC